MASMAEKTMISTQKEVEKLQARLDRLNAKKEKNLELAKKLGCADWSHEEWLRRRHILGERARQQDKMFFDYDPEVLTKKQDEVMWNLDSHVEMEDVEHRLANAKKRLAKATETFLGVQADIEEQESMNQKEQSWLTAIKSLTPEQIAKNRQEAERKYQEWLKQFKAECLKDGIIIDEASANYISGTTKSGKRFVMYINEGWTERSFHCYTLKVAGETIFTSGLFSTGYSVIKR